MGKENKVGVMYFNKTKAGGDIYNIILDAEQLDSLERVDGKVKITGLTNTYKEKESQPDVNLIKPLSKSTGQSAPARATQGATNARSTPNFPFGQKARS